MIVQLFGNKLPKTPEVHKTKYKLVSSIAFSIPHSVPPHQLCVAGYFYRFFLLSLDFP